MSQLSDSVFSDEGTKTNVYEPVRGKIIRYISTSLQFYFIAIALVSKGSIQNHSSIVLGTVQTHRMHCPCSGEFAI